MAKHHELDAEAEAMVWQLRADDAPAVWEFYSPVDVGRFLLAVRLADRRTQRSVVGEEMTQSQLAQWEAGVRGLAGEHRGAPKLDSLRRWADLLGWRLRVTWTVERVTDEGSQS